jgi:hypothetical protein
MSLFWSLLLVVTIALSSHTALAGEEAKAVFGVG